LIDRTDRTRYDYYVTNASLYNGPWRKSSGDTYCDDTQTCTVSMLTGTEVCQSRTDGVDVNVGLEFIKIVAAIFGIEYHVSLSKTACYTASNTTACAWDDGGCHTVFTSQQLLKQTGYRRKRCNWGDGDETECMADIEINTPTDLTTYQCGAMCGREDMVIVSSSSSSLVPSTTILSVTTQVTKSQLATLTVTHSPASTSSSASSTSAILLPASGTIVSASETSSSTVQLNSTRSESGLSAGEKVGIGFGTVILVALLAALGLCYKKRHIGDSSEGQDMTETRRQKPPAYDYQFSTRS